VGIEIHKKVGDPINDSDTLYTIHARNDVDAQEAEVNLLACTSISSNRVEPLPLFYRTIYNS
jgi:thymidine phosphorylase